MSKKIGRQFTCSKMMLPEHRDNLEQHSTKLRWQEETRLPEKDQQLMDELQHTLEQALLQQRPLEITIIKSSGHHTFSGVPLQLDQRGGKIYLLNEHGSRQIIIAREVVSLKPL